MSLVAPDPFNQVKGDVGRRRAQSALPYDSYSPPPLSKSLHRCSVPLPVPFQLEFPEFCSRFRELEQRASLMPVPEAAMHENRDVPPGQHEIWSPREGPVMKTVSEACVPEQFPHLQLGSCVPSANP